MKIVFCKIDIFDLHQNIYIIDANTQYIVAKVTTDELPRALAIIGNENKVDKITLSGNADFCTKIKQDTAYCLNKYNYNNIEIEVVK